MDVVHEERTLWLGLNVRHPSSLPSCLSLSILVFECVTYLYVAVLIIEPPPLIYPGIALSTAAEATPSTDRPTDRSIQCSTILPKAHARSSLGAPSNRGSPKFPSNCTVCKPPPETLGALVRITQIYPALFFDKWSLTRVNWRLSCDLGLAESPSDVSGSWSRSQQFRTTLDRRTNTRGRSFSLLSSARASIRDIAIYRVCTCTYIRTRARKR